MNGRTVLMAVLLLALTLVVFIPTVSGLRGIDEWTVKGFAYVRLNDRVVHGPATLYVENSRYGLQVYLEVGEYAFRDTWLENKQYGSQMNDPDLLERHVCLPPSYAIATGNLDLQYSPNDEDFQNFVAIHFTFFRYKLSRVVLFGRNILFFGAIHEFLSCCEGYD